MWILWRVQDELHGDETQRSRGSVGINVRPKEQPGNQCVEHGEQEKGQGRTEGTRTC